MKIAVLDSDAESLKLICSILNSAGYDTISFSSAQEVFHHLPGDTVDTVILNRQISDASAKEVILWIREKLPAVLPILFVTDRLGEEAIVDALAVGATDFIIQPIRRRELVTRVHIMFQRAYPDHAQLQNIEFGRYVFEPRLFRISFSGQSIEITRKEFELAFLLFRHVNQPLSRAYLLDAVWSSESDIPSRTLDTHISRVRNKLDLHPQNGFDLVSVYGYGYRLEQHTL